MISSPSRRIIRADSKPCSSLSSAQGPPKTTKSSLPISCPPTGIRVLDFRWVLFASR